MSSTESIDRFIEAKLGDSVAELSELCAIPSVAAKNEGLQECADLVRQMLARRGFEVTIMPTAGAPVVYAERKGQSDKTLLFYNHYDVQPAEPFDLWESPPFEADRRDGKLYARGVSDDKGHFTSRLLAIDALLAEEGELPCNVKFVLEGEEEISSVHLPEFIAQHVDTLAADACIWESGGVDRDDTPIQYCGMRGICYVELSVEKLKRDVHSGVGGSIFPNAAWRLVWALCSLKGPDEQINLPGHYDNVVPPSDRDMELMAALPDVADEYRERFGVDEFLGGVTGGADLHRQQVFVPTCTICGLTAGYQGQGSKTVLPARASAKIDFRLVPDQGPEEVVEKLRAHLDAHGFNDVKIDFLGGEGPGRTDPDHPFIQMVAGSAREVYGKPQQIIPMVGGSGPMAAFLEHLHVPIASAGVRHPDSKAHAPNENVRLDLYVKGAQHIARILAAFAGQDASTV